MAALRDLTEAELTWNAASAAALLRQQPEATRRAGFDDPPDGFVQVLREALPCER